MIHDLETISGAFDLAGTFVDGRHYGNGHIHDTFLVRRQDGNRSLLHILQRINHMVFKDPPALTANIVMITAHIRRKLMEAGSTDLAREVLTCIRTRKDDFLHRDAAGNYWRMFDFVTDTTAHDLCSSPDLAREAAKAFGRFQLQLADFPGTQLSETIPMFHHTPTRMLALERAVAADSANRARAAKKEIEFAFARRDIVGIVTSGLESGELPLRVTHNDCKLNNALLDNKTGRSVCIIDLDTVMQGSALYDTGDLIRTATATAMEDERDLSKVDMDLERFEAIVRGYSEAVGQMLNKREKELIPFSGRLFCFMIGIRFLADYLSGDVYFKTHRPDHNLDRARTNFAMTSAIEAKNDRMAAITRRVFDG